MSKCKIDSLDGLLGNAAIKAVFKVSQPLKDTEFCPIWRSLTVTNPEAKGLVEME